MNVYARAHTCLRLVSDNFAFALMLAMSNWKIVASFVRIIFYSFSKQFLFVCSTQPVIVRIICPSHEHWQCIYYTVYVMTIAIIIMDSMIPVSFQPKNIHMHEIKINTTTHTHFLSSRSLPLCLTYSLEFVLIVQLSGFLLQKSTKIHTLANSLMFCFALEVLRLNFALEHFFFTDSSSFVRF